MANTPFKTKFHEALTHASLLEAMYDDLSEEERKEFTLSVCAAHKELMGFRNIIQTMIGFETPPREAASEFIAD